MGLVAAVLGYQPITCMRSIELVALSYAVIESMQRSSAKQFGGICNWQCAFESRAQREADIDKLAQEYQDFDVCLAHLSAACAWTDNAPGVSAAIRKIDKQQKGRDYSLSTCDPSSAPMDALHALVQLVRLTALFREADTSSSDLTGFIGVWTQYLLQKAPEGELRYLLGLAVLDAATVRDVLQLRSEDAALEKAINRQIELYEQEESSDPVEQASVDSRVAALEMRCAQLGSSVRDAVRRSMQSIEHLQSYYKRNRGKRRPTAQDNSMFNLLDGNAFIANHCNQQKKDALVVAKHNINNNEVLLFLKTSSSLSDYVDTQLFLLQLLGLVARVAHAYLVLRVRSSLSPTSSTGSDLLEQHMEYVETALQKVKRAGLGLISKGLGR